MKGRWKVVLAALGSLALALLVNARSLRAQDASMTKQTTLWVNEKTGQVFIRPGRGREPITFGPTRRKSSRKSNKEPNSGRRTRCAQP